MQESISESVFFVLDSQNQPCGGGFILGQEGGERVAVTCAHVLAQAGVKPGGSARLLFDPAKDAWLSSASLSKKDHYPKYDVAFLRLAEDSAPVPPLGMWIPAKPYSTFLPKSPGAGSEQLIIRRGANLMMGTAPKLLGAPLIQLRPSRQLLALDGMPALVGTKNDVVGMVWGQLLDESESLLVIPAETLQELQPGLVCTRESELNAKQAIDLFAQARKAVDSKNFMDALHLLQQALKYELPKDLRDEITCFHVEIEPLSRKEMESREIQSRLKALMAEAENAEGRGDIKTAISVYEEVLSLSRPDVPQAGPLAERAEQQLQRLEYLHNHIEHATRLEEAGRLREAVYIWEEIERSDYRYPPARRHLLKIEQQLEQLDFARAALDNGNFYAAEQILNGLASSAPNEEARYMLDKIQETRLVQEAKIKKADAAEFHGEWDVAVETWEEIIKIFPANEMARQRLERAHAELGRQRAITDEVAKALDMEHDGFLGEAAAAWERTASIPPLRSIAMSQRTRIDEKLILQQKFLRIAEEAEAERRYVDAVQAWAKLTILLPDDEQAQARLKRAKEQLESQLSQQQLLSNTIEAQAEREESLKARLEMLEEADKIRNKIYASMAYPKLLSKRFSSTFLVHIYPKYLSRQATAAVKRQLVKLKKEPDSYNTTRQDTDIQINTLVTVKIECHGIKFTEPVTIEVEDKVNDLIFLAKPEDTCEVGYQIAKFSICDKNTGQEIFSLPFEIQVVDFVVDHISRPLILKLAAGISGLGGVVMYALTLLERVDKTTGLTSGTAFSVVAIATYLLFNNLFQRLHNNLKTL